MALASFSSCVNPEPPSAIEMILVSSMIACPAALSALNAHSGNTFNKLFTFKAIDNLSVA